MNVNNYPSSLDENIHRDVIDDAEDNNKKVEILPSNDFQPMTSSSAQSYGPLNSVEPTSKVHLEKDHAVLDAALISEIDRTMKTHADNLMHELKRVSEQLLRLENRCQNLEKSVDKLRQIENIISEVQAGVQDVKHKQEILETQLQLSQLQISKPEQRPQPQPQLQLQTAAASAPSQSHQQFPPAALPHPPPPTLPNAAPPPSGQHPKQFSQSMPTPVSHHGSYYQPPGQTAEPPPQQYQMPPPQQPQPFKMPPPSPQPQYQPTTHIQYSQPPPTSLQQPNPPQNEPLSIRQPGDVPPPPLQFHGPPTDRMLPRSLLTASAVGDSGVGSSSGSGSGGNMVSIDDAVNTMINMGFSRDQVEASVRKLTNNDQVVDVNVVLDKLMTDPVEMQNPRPWFGT